MSQQLSKVKLDKIKRRLKQAEDALKIAKALIDELEGITVKVDYSQFEGVSGTYDGYAMVGEDGKKYDVPENYAAKTKLVYGDTLKLIEKDGKNIFKQISKVERERVFGILTKKEGEWYILTDRGSYRVLDVAAEFQKAEINSEATAFLPANNLEAPFATLDSVEGYGKAKAKTEVSKERKPTVKAPAKAPAKPKKVTKKKDTVEEKELKSAKEVKEIELPDKQTKKAEKDNTAKTDSSMEDDDLV